MKQNYIQLAIISLPTFAVLSRQAALRPWVQWQYDSTRWNTGTSTDIVYKMICWSAFINSIILCWNGLSEMSQQGLDARNGWIGRFIYYFRQWVRKKSSGGKTELHMYFSSQCNVFFFFFKKKEGGEKNFFFTNKLESMEMYGSFELIV